MTLGDDAYDRLLDQSIDFAATLTAIVNGTVADRARFIPRVLEDRDLVWIYPRGSRPGNVALIPIVAGLAESDTPRLFLRTFFVCRLDDSEQWLTIHQSVLTLVVHAGGKPRPVIRMEYDRDEGSDPDDEAPTRQHTRSAAHVQIHGTSAELAYARDTLQDLGLKTLESR